jgi:hypothetical protein
MAGQTPGRAGRQLAGACTSVPGRTSVVIGPATAVRRLVVTLAAAAVLAAPGSTAADNGMTTTFAAAGRAALATLLNVYYGGNGLWNLCDRPGCPQANSDWGADSLTYALYLRWATAHDPAIGPVMSTLVSTSPGYPTPCQLPGCQSWSDVPQWDAIADVREYQVTGDAQALTNAETAFEFDEGSNAYALGACPEIRYQQPAGEINQLKTLETDANAIKAAILLYQATGEASYLQSAVGRYAAVRAYFLDPTVPLYTVYVFDDGTACTQLPHRFFASVNGDMIWNGLELSKLTGQAPYLDQALATATATADDLDDGAGVFADLQAENDVVEPLVEAMYALATEAGSSLARSWILANAAAAISARSADGSFGRFFDGPPPRAAVTAWQTNGGLALEIAAAALDPDGVVSVTSTWAGARRTESSLGPTGSVRFRGSGIALIGTLGEACCEPGHARVFVDGAETFDQTGIWQNKSSLGKAIPGTVLFAWRWRRSGTHTIGFAPGVPNGKEGPSFLHIRSYLTLP